MLESFSECGNLLFVGQSQDHSAVCVGGSRGFAIFSAHDFSLLVKEDIGPVARIEMLYQTSLLALVGYGCGDVVFPSNQGLPPSSSKQLTMWNIKEKKSITKMTFPTPISTVKLNRKRCVVLLRSNKIHIFDTVNGMALLHTVDKPGMTGDASLCWLCSGFDHGWLVMPWQFPVTPIPREQGGDEPQRGVVWVMNTYTLKVPGTVMAHHNQIQALCCNAGGELMASASTKGTVIRVFELPTFERVAAFRRGTTDSLIHSLQFSADSTFVMCGGSSETVHLFKLCPSASKGSPVPAMAVVSPTSQLSPNPTPGITTIADDGAQQDQEGGDSMEKMVSVAGEKALHMAKGTLDSTVKSAYATVANYLPQNARDIIETSRAFATIHLKQLGDRPLLACRPVQNSSGSYEVSVATQQGFVYVYDLNAQTGGECRLISEHCFYWTGEGGVDEPDVCLVNLDMENVVDVVS